MVLLVDLFGTLVPKWPSRSAFEVKSRMASYLEVEVSKFLRAWEPHLAGCMIGRITIEDSKRAATRELCCHDIADTQVRELDEMWISFVRGLVQPRDDAIATLRW